MHGLEMSRDHGIHVWDHMIYGLGVYGSILKGDRDAASRFLDRMKSTLMMERKQGFCHYHHVAGWYNAVFGNTADALSHAELAVKLASEISGSGVYFPEILCRFGLADILCDREDYEGAGRQLAAGRKLTARTGSTIMEFTQRLLEARIAFGTGNDAQGLRRLQAALRLGRRHDFAGTLWRWWRSSRMAGLCEKALESGIETEYVRELIAVHRLIPDEPPVHIDDWPWPVKVFVLGGFELRKHDIPAAFPKKTQKKPLQLLKVLITRGGRPVREEECADLLWPDSEGDAARKSVNVTVVRLRNLLGVKEAVIYREGNVSLDSRQCWVDAWAFEGILERAESKQKSRRPAQDGRLDKAFALYRGPFLPGEQDPWTISYRERLRNRLLRQVEAVGRELELAGRHEKAIAWYLKGVDADELAEPFYQRIIASYQKLGRRAEALSVYRRCRERLAACGIEPAAETEALHARLTARRR